MLHVHVDVHPPRDRIGGVPLFSLEEKEATVNKLFIQRGLSRFSCAPIIS